jgi:propionate CoA-transferase
MGVGGFVNISQAAKTLVYCGTFTAGGQSVAIGGGGLRVVKEGSERKFLAEVEEITFSGAEAARKGQRVLYITERAVFELRNGRMTLTEVAPGVDVQRDVLSQMDFTPDIAEPLAAMPAEIFQPQWGKLHALIEAKAH